MRSLLDHHEITCFPRYPQVSAIYFSKAPSDHCQTDQACRMLSGYGSKDVNTYYKNYGCLSENLVYPQ